jgi:hypothetical protein
MLLPSICAESETDRIETEIDSRTAVLAPHEGGVHADLVWQVTVLRPILRLLAPLLRPAFAWSHRWITPRGEKGLRDYLAQKNGFSPEHDV